MEGFVGSGDPELNFIFDLSNEILLLAVQGDCKVSEMREIVKSVGHDLYLPFTKSLEKTADILARISEECRTSNKFRPSSYSCPEGKVTGSIEVPNIVAKYGHVYTMTPSHYWDHENRTTFLSLHSNNIGQMYVDWENPKKEHIKWQQVIWMKHEFHFGFRCKGFAKIDGFDPISESAVLVIRLSKEETGRLSGLMSKMLEDYNYFSA